MANNKADYTKLSDNFKSYLDNLNKKEEEKKLSSSSENAPKIPDGVSANFRKYLEDMQSGKTARTETPKITGIEKQDLITGKKMPSTFDAAKNAGRIPAISDENAMWNKFAAPKLEENAKKDAETYLKTGSVTKRRGTPEEYPLMVEQNVKKLAARDFVNAVQNAKDSQKPANISREAAKYNEKNAAERFAYDRFKENENKESLNRAAKQAKITEAKNNPNVISKVKNTNPSLGEVYKYARATSQDEFDYAMRNIIDTVNSALLSAQDIVVNAPSAMKEAADVLSGNGQKYYENYINGNARKSSAADEYLNKSNEEFNREVLREETDSKYPKAAKSKAGKTAASVAGTIGGAIPTLTASAYGIPAYISQPLINMTSSYKTAKNEGATNEQAYSFATVEMLKDAPIQYLTSGYFGVDDGLLTQNARNVIAKLNISPVFKTILGHSARMAGEGAEGALSSLTTQINKKMIYAPDSKIDPNNILYGGLLQAGSAGILSIPRIFEDYAIYRSDYEFVNAFSNRASRVSDTADAENVRKMGEAIEKASNAVLENDNVPKETKARVEYVKNGVAKSVEILDDYENRIILDNNEFTDLTDDVSNAAKKAKANGTEANVNPVKGDGDVVTSATALVKKVAQDIEPTANPVNKTIDKILDGIQAQNDIISSAETQEAAAEAQQKKNDLIEADNAVRENRKAIEENLKSDETAKSETAVTETPEADNSALTENVDGATINSEIPEAPTEKPFTLDHTTAVHTKTKEPIEVFKIQGNLEDSEYKALKAQMKSIGGYYSSFVKGFIVPSDKVNDVSNFANVIDKTSKENPTEAPHNADIVSESDSPAEKETVSPESVTEEAKTELKKDALNVKIKSTEGADANKIVTLVKDSSRTYAVKHDGEDYFTDGYVLQKVSKETLSEIQTSLAKLNKEVETSDIDLFNQFATDNIVSPTTLPYKTYKIPSGKTAVAIEFETPDGAKVFVNEKYVKHFDNKNNVWGLVKIKGRDNYALVSMSETGDINGIALPIKTPAQASLEQSPFKSKSKLFKDITPASQSMSKEETAPQKKSSDQTQTITSQTETDNIEVKEKHRAMENGVLPTVVPEVSTSVSDAGNGVATETVASDSVVNTFYSRIADKILNEYLETGAVLDSKALVEIAREIYGGTLAEGAFSIKDATDSLELAVNRYILSEMQKDILKYNGKTAESAVGGIEWAESVLQRIPTQTKRTEEQITLQQFSTPPNIAYLANWLANIDSSDFMLEPSAGIGGIASFAKAFGATTAVNEISDRRLGALRSLGFDHVTSEDGAQLDNILPDYIKPTVVVMNPPFSSTGGRTKNSTANAKPHVEQALGRLENGGRLVAILGQGMSNDAPLFAGWWDSLRSQGYDIRANIGIDGSNYRKYGTTFNVRLVVIDKTGNQTGNTITGDYTNLHEIPKVLEEIRNDRRKNSGTAESDGAVESGGKTGVAGISEQSQPDIGRGNGRVPDGDNQRSRGVEVRQIRGGDGSESFGQPEMAQERSASDIQDNDDAERERDRGRGGRTDRGLSAVGNQGEQEGRVDSRESVSGNVRNNGTVGESDSRVSRTSVKKAAAKKANTSDDGIYAGYVPSKLTVKNAQKHPANLVESSAMAAVPAPTITYTPHIDQSVIDNGLISDVQLENISYAGQAHEKTLESGARKGYFIGDGTGVGKGRQAAGIILDNFNQGRKKALWISFNRDLMSDAQRDWRDIGGNPEDIFDADAIKKGIGKRGNKKIPTEGILFTSYSTVGTAKGKNADKANVDLIIDWLGNDFDGVIVYDEAHTMNNLIPKKGSRGSNKPSQRAIAANKIQDALPNARVVYMSATGASEVNDLCFASRLGIWGKGTAFANAQEFVDKIGASGIAGMELVASSLKAMGAYQARSISYEGVKYDTIKHPLDKSQKFMYNTYAEAWQIIYQNMERAIRGTAITSKDVGKVRSRFYSLQQNFFNQVLTTMSMPSVIEDIKKSVNKGYACVVQLVNTNESQLNEALDNAKSEGKDLEELDITPRRALLNFLEEAFPVQQYEDFLDEHGNKQSRPVFDSKGKPVLNKQAVAARDELIERVKEMSIPEGPLDMIINAFGADKVAEVTGRSKRVVTKTDENGNPIKVEESIAQPSFRMAETKAFQNGDKNILVFSGAGSTGVSFHSDKRAKNQKQRRHYIPQPGFNSKTAVQSFGRTHRSNEANVPEYVLVQTDVEGQKRFTSTIARRLDQLGALTKGQRQTGSGIFGEKDNLESPLSITALHEFLKRLGSGSIQGVNGEEVFRKLGLYNSVYDKDGVFQKSAVTNIEMSRFLNRLLALKVDEQNIVFGEFESIRQQMYDEAIASGTLDMGIANVKADKISVVQEEVIYTDENTGAETKYVKATAYRKPQILKTVEDAAANRNAFQKLVRMRDGSVRAVYRIADETDAFGRVVKKYLLQSPNKSVQSRYNETNLIQKTTDIPKEEWNAAWDEEVKKVPEFNESTLHVITGTLLPVWNKLPQDGNIKALKIVTDNGDQILGRIISSERIDEVLRGLNIKEKKDEYTGKQLYDIVMKSGNTVNFNTYRGSVQIKRSRVANENRLEITGSNLWAVKSLKFDYPDIFEETIQYTERYFIPTGEKGIKILEDLNSHFTSNVEKKNQSSLFFSKSSAIWENENAKNKKGKKTPSVKDLTDAARQLFGLEINTGKIGKSGVSGIYKTHANTIRTQVYGDIPTIAHELGHAFDKKYNFSESQFINGLVNVYRDDLIEADYNESVFPNEAIAYYFADLLRDKQTAYEKSEEFSKYLDQTLNDNDRKKLAQYIDMANAYFAADSISRRKAQIRYRHKDKSAIGQAKFQVDTFMRNPQAYMGKHGRDFIRYLFDDIVDLKPFGLTYNYAKKERASNTIAHGRLTIAFTDNNGKIIGKSLAAILNEGGINDMNITDFEAYLVARAALDRIEAHEKDPSINALVYADESLQNKESLIRDILKWERENPTFADTAREVYVYKNNLLDISVDSGIISEELAENLKKTFPHYVPLNRVVDSRYPDKPGTGKKTPKSLISRFKGSGRPIYTPIENLAVQTAIFTRAIQQNETRKALFDFIDENEDMGIWAERVTPDRFFDTVSTQEIKENLAAFDSESLSKLSENEKTLLFDDLINAIGNRVGMWKMKGRQGEDIVSVMRNGKPTYYEIHDDGLMQALTTLSPRQMGKVTQVAATLTRWFATLTTGANPKFIAKNAIRDAQTAFTFSKTRNNPFVFTVELFKAFGGALTENEDYRKYMAHGGGYTGNFTSNIKNMKHEYKTLVKNHVDQSLENSDKSIVNLLGKLFSMFKNPIGTVVRLGEAVEAAPRFAEYLRNLKNGEDALTALVESQNITVDFQQGGIASKQINHFIPFFNAAMTSTYQNLTRLGKGASARTYIKWLASTLLMTSIQLAWLGIINQILPDKDDSEEAYANLSTYNKFANWNFYIGDGQFIRIPKDKQLSLPTTLLSALYEKYILENPDAFYNYGEYIGDIFLPEGLENMTLVGAVLDIYKNETFTGAPIVPSAYSGRAKELQYNEKTSQLAIFIGSKLGLSPMRIDYIIDDQGGFVGDLILNLTKQGGTNAKDILDVADSSKKSLLGGLPVSSDFFRDTAYSTDIVTLFYNTKEKYDTNAASYKATSGKNAKYTYYDVYGKYKYGKVADLYGDVNKMIKADGNSDSARKTRFTLNSLIKSVNRTEKTWIDEATAEISQNANYEISDIAPYIVVPEKLKDSKKNEYYLDAYDMMNYFIESQILFESYYGRIIDSDYSDEEKAAAMKEAKKAIKKQMDDDYLWNFTH